MPAHRKKPDAVLACTLPKVRIYPEQLQSVKQAATAQRLSISDFIRIAVLSAIPKPISRQCSTNPLQTAENANSSSSPSQSEKLSNGKPCIHGYKVIRGATQCPTCANLGIQYRYQYD